jgi:hypothetical protein
MPGNHYNAIGTVARHDLGGQSHDRLGPRRRSVAVAPLRSTACLHPEPLDRLGQGTRELWAK